MSVKRKSAAEKKQEFIIEYYDTEDRVNFTPEDREKLKSYVEEGCKKKWPVALEFKAYACYGGNDIYDCDWYASRDCLLTLVDIVGEENPMLYNTLGYIYYYGRCNDGVPEYDLAFKYFSVGSANGVFESMYKLSDMFSKGLGVPKNLMASARIITGMYDENLEIFCNEGFSGKFADVALRLGGLYEKGAGLDMDPEKAYYYYLQASYAIDRRIRDYSCYGDEKVKQSIAQALERAEAKLGENYHTGSRSYEAPAPFGIMLSESSGMDVELFKKGRKHYLRATRLAGEDCLKKVLITIPEAGYCSLVNDFTLYIKGISNINVDELPSKAFITAIHYDEQENLWEFACRDRVLLSFTCKEFVFEKEQ